MCGICGIVDHSGRLGLGEPERLAALVTAMRDAMRHRGPDDGGLYVGDGGRVALGHRRLAIVDLRPEGGQPMANEDGSVQVVFNGEIYGHAPLRARLEREGHVFRTRTDTEVLPHLLEGADATTLPERIALLDGMYAFAAWQVKQRRLLLGRDPFGKKPLYWMQGDGFIAFSSELRPLAMLPGAAAQIDRDALAEYLLLQYVHAPRTIWSRVRKLEPGCTLAIDFGDGAPTIRHHRHWRFVPDGAIAAPTGMTLESAAEQLRPILIRAVEKRLMSDVPLGAFLSGGVDSALVVGIMRCELDVPVETFSIGFAGTDETEHEQARAAAVHLGCRHRDELLHPDAIALVRTIAARLDEPNGDSSCLPTYLLCEHARRFVTVALSGDGGDELFGGYGRYRDTLNDRASAWRRLMLRLRGQRASSVSELYLSPRWLIWQPEDVAALLGGADSLPSGVATELASWAQRLDDPSRHPLNAMRELDVETYMPGAVLAKVDRMSMLHSLEVRSPLLDRDVADFAATLPVELCWEAPSSTKRLLRHLAGRYLPPEWMHRKKMGFGLPASTWAPERLLTMARELLLGESAQVAALLDRDELRRRLEHMTHPGCFSIYRLWPLLVLELWLRSVAGTRNSGSTADLAPASM